MSTDSTTHDIIASVLRLPLADREQILHVLQESLIDDTIDHGPDDPADEVETAWDDEIVSRIADIDSGRVKTIPSEEAWKMIDGQAPPKL